MNPANDNNPNMKEYRPNDGSQAYGWYNNEPYEDPLTLNEERSSFWQIINDVYGGR